VDSNRQHRSTPYELVPSTSRHQISSLAMQLGLHGSPKRPKRGIRMGVFQQIQSRPRVDCMQRKPSPRLPWTGASRQAKIVRCLLIYRVATNASQLLEPCKAIACACVYTSTWKEGQLQIATTLACAHAHMASSIYGNNFLATVTSTCENMEANHGQPTPPA